MGTLGDLLDRLDPEPNRRGRQFERICQWFLTHSPVHAALLRPDRVWLWDEWPGQWGPDDGIDLVAEAKDGDLWAIQAKAYAASTSITKADVDSFLSASGRPQFSFRLLIATTDLVGPKATSTIGGQEKQAQVLGRAELEEFDIEWPDSPDDLQAPQAAPSAPRPYQREAIDGVLSGFDRTDRGQLIMACGTGKTLTGLFIKEQLAAERSLVLVPSLSLLGQTVRQWTANKTMDFEPLPVCSDKTVADPDAAIGDTKDLGFPVTTDEQDIASFLRRSGPRVVFATYQSSPRVAKALTHGDVPGFDLAIADEAHRCAGRTSSDFGTILDSSLIPARRRLFMTATPRYFTGRVVREAAEADFEVASMNDEVAFGPVFHKLGFAEAIERELLTSYQVVVVGVDDATYRGWAQRGQFVTIDGQEVRDARTLAGQIGIAKAMNRYDLRRVITFHSRVKSAEQFARSLPEVIAWMPAEQQPAGQLWTAHASGEMTARQRQVRLHRLGKIGQGERGLLANARCLSEGVDVPTLDGVAFIDPRRSEVDIVQAVGRAIRLAPDKTVGTIVIPVFIDTERDPAVALDDSAFKPVWDVIKALRSHDEDLGDELDELRRQLGRTGQPAGLPGKIHLDLPVRIGTAFAEAFDVRLVDETTSSWEFWFGMLQEFVELNSHARVPQLYAINGFSLGKWVNKQRARRSSRTFPLDRQQRLEGLPGWTWEPKAELWEEGFSTLLKYIERHGHALVPQSFIGDGYPLGRWVSKQRARYAEGTLDADRRRRLEAASGWTWDPSVDQWEQGFGRLSDYVDSHGDARVPRSYRVDGYKLGQWVITQRTKHSQGTMEAERADRLEQFPGWTWEPFAEKWEEGFSHLLVYVELNGHTRVPASYTVDGFKLGQWTTLQRQEHNKGKLDSSRERRLIDVRGWTWDPVADLWEEGFRRLLSYVELRGDALVPQTYSSDGYQLGAWVNTQRRRHAKGTLEPDRARQLQAQPGWTWAARTDQWEDNFRCLQAYVEVHRNARVPRTHTVDGLKIGQWVINQRAKRETLDAHRRHRLEALPGWTWDTHADKWEEGFRHLQTYVETYGDARVPRPHTINGYKLGSWVMIQRGSYNKGTLDADRQVRLQNLPGWVWDPHADRWEQGFSRLAEYAKTEGHTKVPQGHTAEGYRLGAWVAQQRFKQTEGTLTADRQERLEELPGWTWRASPT
ncbi:Putative DNA repair helicase RadD [Mycobacterium simulans]|uniref:DEAD/DEAH box helicase n=1 Tax=Mycobacterium simulans TaxID=627089 RepID=UPI001748837C|nr:DEAD/DEAH box helicase [Mycobacterium simulans]SON61726.1 Putative DNA repair helicase RadD [Mycobacterium simulans]